MRRVDYEADVEAAVIEERDACRLPTPRHSQWFRDSLVAAFDDVDAAQAQRKKTLVKRRTELANMQDRLLSGYLAGTIDEASFTAKSADLKRQAEEVERQLDETDGFDPAFGQAALAVFDFSQNLVPRWHGSNSAGKRELLECVSLNRALTDVSLVLTNRKPFDFLAERPFLKKSRGERRWSYSTTADRARPAVYLGTGRRKRRGVAGAGGGNRRMARENLLST